MSDTVAKDIAALERVLFRLASADDARMLEVLQPLLPQLLVLFPRDLTAPLATALKDKILQVVAHIKTRLTAMPQPQLPLVALSALLRDRTHSVFTHNVAFMFIEIGFAAAPANERTAVLATLFESLATHSSTQQETFFRLLLRALPIAASAVCASSFPTPNVTAASDVTLTSSPQASASPPIDTIDANIETLLDFVLDVQLVDFAALSATDTGVIGSTTVVTYGLSPRRLARLQRVLSAGSTTNRTSLLSTQLDALRFVLALDVAVRYKLAVVVAGAGATHHSVKTVCDEQLTRVLKHDDAQLEDASTVRRLLALALGSAAIQRSASSSPGVQSDAIELTDRTRLNDASVLHVLALLRSSKAATRVAPLLLLQLLCDALFGTDAMRPAIVAHRIAVAALQLSLWTFTHADATIVEHLFAPVLLPSLLRAVMASDDDGNAAMTSVMRATFRQGIYDQFTMLATRAPGVVAATEQVFQVLLVRSLVEEEARSSNASGAGGGHAGGAHALRAFTAVATAYRTHASIATQHSIRNELTALLQGSRLFDATKSYARVRAAVATWCHALLRGSSTAIDSDSNTAAAAADASDLTMRFALLRLCGDADTDVQTLATAALYSAPVPSLANVAVHLRTAFPQATDLVTRLQDAQTIESCVRFCLHVAQQQSPPLASDFDNMDDQSTDTNDRRCVVEYVAATLLLASNDQQAQAAHAIRGDAAARTRLVEAAATCLVDLGALDCAAVAAVMQSQLAALLRVTLASANRRFLHDVAALVQLTLADLRVRINSTVHNIVEPITAALVDPQRDAAQTARLAYPLGAALAVLAQRQRQCHAHAASDSDSDSLAATATVARRAFRTLVTLLTATVTTCSTFASFPRNEDDQNARIDLLRSLLDGVGLAGDLTPFVTSAAAASDEDWIALVRERLTELTRVLTWDLSRVSADGSLKLKLARLQTVALENLRRALVGLPHTGDNDNDSSNANDWTRLTPALTDVFDALLRLGNDPDPELQVLVGEALVTLGNYAAGASIDGSTEEENTKSLFASNRAAAILMRLLNDCATSRQPTMRRSTATWLLCICAAGLASLDDASPSHAEPSQRATSWHALLASEATTPQLIATHEFFVTMLNDSDSVAKESAVKGLAYLRLCAPRESLGDQFSDSLFRRLRCFRAFVSAPSPAASAALDADDAVTTAANDRGQNEPPELARPTPTPNLDASIEAPTLAMATTGSTVENAAYREVSNVAADVGDPELMYALLYLSTTDPLWHAMRDAHGEVHRRHTSSRLFAFAAADRAFHAALVKRAGALWTAPSYANANTLVPWLFLLKHHANSNVADVMTGLWHIACGNTTTESAESAAATTATTPEKTLVQTHWQTIFAFVLGRLERSRNFRYREAACRALVELLHSADAVHVRLAFLHLWKLAAAAVDDVMAQVGVAGLKLYKYMGELSLRIAATDDACRRELLAYLVADAIVSKSAVCRTLAIDVLLRLVKALPAAALTDALAPLLLKLLECLSSLEMSELQYAQFHVEKKEQLERLRVSISQASPVGQLLALATTRLCELAGDDATNRTSVTIVEEVARGAAALLRFGVGLNTRVGTANFVATLARELPFELRASRGAEWLLLKVFTPFVATKTTGENDVYGDDASRYRVVSGGSSSESESLADGLVVHAYCRAAASLCPLVDAAVVRSYVRNGIFAVGGHRHRMKQPSGSDATATSGTAITVSDDSNAADGVIAMEIDEPSTAQTDAQSNQRFLLIAAIATKELVAKVPVPVDTMHSVDSSSNDTQTTIDWYCTHVFPGAFIGQFAAPTGGLLSTTWCAVLDDLPPSVRFAAASIDATLVAITTCLRHSAWGTRQQAARALHALFVDDARYRSRITVQQTARIRQRLLDAVPGRLWTGKGVLLEALVALVSADDRTDDSDTGAADTSTIDALSSSSTTSTTRRQLAALLLRESERAYRQRDVAYMESAITSFGALSAQMTTNNSVTSDALQRLEHVSALRRAFACWLEGKPSMESLTGSVLSPSTAVDDNDINTMDDVDSDRAIVGATKTATNDSAFVVPPLLIKCVLDALAQTWPSSLSIDDALPTSPKVQATATRIATETLAWLCDCVTRSSDHVFQVWSVRRAVFSALAAVVASVPVAVLMDPLPSSSRPTNASMPDLASVVLSVCGSDTGVMDAKYAVVRVAAASVLVALLQRHHASVDLALLLTVHRERISALVDVLRASDEPAEQRVAFAIRSQLLELQ